MTQFTGGCLCGAIRYACNEQPLSITNCHCKHCQRQSGSAFSVNMAVPATSVSITKGTTAVFSDVGTSGKPVYRHFCRECGSPILSTLEAARQLVFVKAGTLDDTSIVNPSANIWCSSAQTWVPYQEGAPQFSEGRPASA
jgi:hypothetical protein